MTKPEFNLTELDGYSDLDIRLYAAIAAKPKEWAEFVAGSDAIIDFGFEHVDNDPKDNEHHRKISNNYINASREQAKLLFPECNIDALWIMADLDWVERHPDDWQRGNLYISANDLDQNYAIVYPRNKE